MAVQEIIESTFFDTEGQSASGEQPLVTISGEYGAGTKELGPALAERLHVGYFDASLLDRIVEQAQDDKRLGSRLDDLFPEFLDNWLYKLSYSSGSKRSDYYLHLVKTIMGISRRGGVIDGRGAHLILAGQKVFRLKVEAGLEYCTRQVAEREGVSQEWAAKLITKMDQERIRFVKEVYKRFPTNNTYYDLVLGAETLEHEAMLRITVKAMQLAGFNVP